MPSAQTEYAGTGISGNTTRRVVDLTNMTQVLLVIYTSTGTFATGPFLDIQYSTNISTPSWTDFNIDLVFTASDTVYNSGWVTIPVGARGLVLLRLVGQSGDGTADPTLRIVTAQFKA